MIVTQMAISTVYKSSAGYQSKIVTAASEDRNCDQTAMTVKGRPPLSNTRTSLPQTKSKFDLEPNPFEQSFKDNPPNSSRQQQQQHQQQTEAVTSPSLNYLLNGFSKPRRARSSSPHNDCRLSPAVIRGTPSASPSKVSLPGIASITSPTILNLTPDGISKISQATNYPQTQPNAPSSSSSSSVNSLSNFGWGFNSLGADSLRPDPLSPALLNGTSQGRMAHSGLTPLITMGHSNHGALTPTTQAIIAMLSSNESVNPSDATISSSTTKQMVDSADSCGDEISFAGPARASDSALGAAIGLEPPTVSDELSAASNSATPGPDSIGSLVVDPSSHISKSILSENVRNTVVSQKPSLRSDGFSIEAASGLPSSTKLPGTYSALSSNAPSSARSNKKAPEASNFLVKPLESTLGANQATIAAISDSSANSVLHSASPVSQNTATILNPAHFNRSTSVSLPPAPQIASINAVNLSKSLSGTGHPKSSNVASVTTAATQLNSINPPNPSTDVCDHYTRNPLYLLTAAHEASSLASSRNARHKPCSTSQADMLDDATANAAAALTGLGSSGGSRYPSPGPNVNSSSLGSQTATINPVAGGSKTSSPALSSHRLTMLSGPPATVSVSITPILTNGVGMAHPSSNQINSTDQRKFSEPPPPSAQSSSSISSPRSRYFPEFNGSSNQLPSLPSTVLSAEDQLASLPYGTSSGRKKGKKRKEPWAESGSTFASSKEESKTYNRRGPKSVADEGLNLNAAEQSLKGSKTADITLEKRGKKTKAEEDSEYDSDGADGFWAMEDQHGLSLKEVNAANQELDFNNSNDRLENKNRRQSVGGNGKPETEEEKRRNFLERNRQAALKCRQRKKAWLANLQTKVGMLTTENESLQMTINQLREEIDSFRSILVSHKDCPISVGNNRAACTTIGELVGHETGLAANAAAIIVQQQQNSRAPLQHHQHPVSTVHHSQQGQNFQRPSTGPNHRYATGVAPQFSNGY